jgi:hypothetical protein
MEIPANVILAATPATSLQQPWGGGWDVGQNFLTVAGGLQMSNSATVDGVDATAGYQGSIATPGQEALQEIQLQTNVSAAELGASGGSALTYVLKSGTNHIHGSLFEIL